MRKFDYSFLNNGLLPANLVNLTSNIAALKTMAGVRKEEYSKIIALYSFRNHEPYCRKIYTVYRPLC